MDLLHGMPFGFSFFWYFCDISFQLFKLLCLAKDHWWGVCTIWSILLMKFDLKWCIHLDLFLYFNHFTYLVSVTAGGPESPWGHMQPSSTVDFSWFVVFREHQLFPCWNLLKLSFFWGLFTILFGFSLFWHFCDISFQLFSYFVWLRITDDRSVLEMRIWSILLSLFSYCKSQTFTLNTLWGVLQNISPKHVFRLSKGRGSTFIFKFVLSLCNQISTSTFDLRFAIWCPLNLKMLPTPLQLNFMVMVINWSKRI